MATSKLKYETEEGTIVRIRLDDKKKTAAGTEPTAALDEPNWFISVNASSRSRTRLRARGWLYTREVPVTGEERKLIFTVFIPKLTPAAYDGSTETDLDYDGETYKFARKVPEA